MLSEELSMIGQRVMVRTYSAGVHFGTLKWQEGQSAILWNAHRVHYWEGACSETCTILHIRILCFLISCTVVW